MSSATGSSGPQLRRQLVVPFPPTWPAVIFGLSLLALAALVAMTKDALAPYVIGLVLVFLMNGLVDRMARAGLPRWAGTLVAIVALIAAIVVFVYVVLSALITQFATLIDSLPEIAQAVRGWLVDLRLPESVYQGLASWLDTLPASIPVLLPEVFGVVLSGVGGLAAIFIAVAGLPFWIFYALSDSPAVMRGLQQAVPPSFRSTTFALLGILGDVFGAWARGQVLLSISVAIPFFVAFTIFGWTIDPHIGDYALLFAFTFGVAEFVPIVGPVIVFVPILVITLAVAGPPGGIAVALLFVVIEQLEGAVLIPRIQGKALNLHPVVILPALVIGSALAGLMGAILALPVAAAIRRMVAYLLHTTGGADSASEPTVDSATAAVSDGSPS